MMCLLVEKKLVTQQEAADLFVSIAHDFRTLTEGDTGEPLGETMAGRYETLAGWMLGMKPEL